MIVMVIRSLGCSYDIFIPDDESISDEDIDMFDLIDMV